LLSKKAENIKDKIGEALELTYNIIENAYGTKQDSVQETEDRKIAFKTILEKSIEAMLKNGSLGC
jgi:hypothetical protein